MWIRNMKKYLRGSSRGMTAVEGALALPLLMILALSIVETGNMAHSWLTVYKAAQTGARFAATGEGEEDGSRQALIQLKVEEVMDRLPGGASGINVSNWANIPVSGSGAAGPGSPCGLVEVEVVYDYAPVTPLAGSVFPEVVTLTGSDRKMIEPYKPCD